MEGDGGVDRKSGTEGETQGERGRGDDGVGVGVEAGAETVRFPKGHFVFCSFNRQVSFNCQAEPVNPAPWSSETTEP